MWHFVCELRGSSFKAYEAEGLTLFAQCLSLEHRTAKNEEDFRTT